MNRQPVFLMTLLFLVSISSVTLKVPTVEASGTIYITADGSIDPPTAPISTVDNVTYVLTGNITSDGDGIVIERNNTIVDGAGYTLQGAGSETGISLNETTNVIIQNTTIEDFHYGIYLWGSSNAERASSSNTITGNNITNNGEGIYLWFSHYNSIIGNNITNNGIGIDLQSSSTHNSIVENNLRGNSNGIVLYGYSSRNNVTRNNITNNNLNGIFLNYESHSNSISENTIANSESAGIWLYDSGNNVIWSNNIVNNSYGVRLGSNAIFGEYNIFYHNNFIDNPEQVYGDYVSLNFWDDGYLSGGNFWSDYTGVDTHSGRYQNQTGSDGIGDTPYGSDSYPLMNVWTPTAPISYTIRVPADFPTIQEAISVAGAGYTVFVYNGTYHERLVITKPVSLIGEDPTVTIIDGGENGTVIGVNADNVVVQNLTIRNSGTGTYYSSAGVSIANSGAGPWYYGNAIISNNIIANNGDWGIQFYYSSGNIVLENNITNNSNGIILYSSRNNTISGNNIASNSGNGVQFSESGDNNVFENDIENNSDCGIAFYTTSSDNTITGNNITKNKYGVYLQQAYNNKFYHNNFISNLNQVYAAPPIYGYVSANIWDNGYPSGGNYWSDYTGTDANHDGIGDTPYIIDADNTDNYPLMTQFIIPEFPSFLILPILFIATLFAVIIYKRKHPQNE